VTDTKGNAYQLAVGPTTVAGALTQSIHYAKNIAAAAAGANTVTVSFTVAANYPDIRILEYGGMDSLSPVDVTASATGSTATSSTPAVGTTNASDLLFAANTVATWTTGAGAGWTSRVITSPDGDIAEDRVVSTAGSYSATASLGGAGAWVMQMVAFKATSSAPPAPPTAPTNLAASAAGSSQINLSWTNTSTTQTGVKIERSTDNVTFTQITVAGATAVSYSDAGLSASTTYFYRARATNAAGDSAYSNTASATTQAPSPPPTAPTNLAATAAGSSQINLSWTNTSTTQTGVKIERSTDNVSFTQIAVAGATAVSYSNTGLSASTTYFYRVRATNNSGDSPYSNTASATTQSPPPNGQWSAVLSWPLVAVHMTLLPTGKILAWDDHTDNVGADVFDPATNTLTAVPFFIANLFCAGHALLPDGRVFVAGGHTGTTHVGIPNSTFFDPSTQSWSSGPSMSVGRWYPSVTSLPDGRMLVTAGETNCDGCNALIPEIYDPATNSWTRLTLASHDFPYYPHMFVLPDGRILAASSNRAAIASVALDLTLQRWSVVDPAVLDGGSAATYAPGKIIKSGLGRDPDLPGAPSVATTYVIDMTQQSPAWRQTASMAFPRTEHNLTPLPDGTVLVTGGSRNSDVGDTAGAVLEAELWSPTTETWTVLAAMRTPRMYHSTAVLLPDARVLVAGGGRDFPEVDQPSAEIYSPPYLFKGPPPAITSAPTGIQYGTVFFVRTPDAARIATASLVRLGSVTHAFNENQRFVPLSFQSTSGGLNVQAPATANLAPPGHYMLFIVDTNGIPSLAAMVRLS
jgi:hypothetical protein